MEILTRELGPVGMVRFFQQFETRRGDYSVERHRWPGKRDVQSLAKQIRKRRKMI